jgi:hypothetical protein
LLAAEVCLRDDRPDDHGAVDDDVTAAFVLLAVVLLVPVVLLALALLALALTLLALALTLTLTLALPLALALTLALPLALALALTLVVLRECAAQPTDPGDPEDHRDDVRQRALLCPLHCRSSPTVGR